MHAKDFLYKNRREESFPTVFIYPPKKRETGLCYLSQQFMEPVVYYLVPFCRRMYAILADERIEIMARDENRAQIERIYAAFAGDIFAYLRVVFLPTINHARIAEPFQYVLARKPVAANPCEKLIRVYWRRQNDYRSGAAIAQIFYHLAVELCKTLRRNDGQMLLIGMLRDLFPIEIAVVAAVFKQNKLGAILFCDKLLYLRKSALYREAEARIIYNLYIEIAADDVKTVGIAAKALVFIEHYAFHHGIAECLDTHALFEKAVAKPGKVYFRKLYFKFFA